MDLWSGHLFDEAAFQLFADRFAEEHSTLRWGLYRGDGSTQTLHTAHGGMKVFWLYEGAGEVFLPEGYRTKEGDGAFLPDTYQPEEMPQEFMGVLNALKEGFANIVSEAQPPVRAILDRVRGNAYVGDCANDLWKLEHLPRPWSSDSGVEAALARLFACHRTAGYSIKRDSSWESLMEGDQLVLAGGNTLQVKGHFACLTLERVGRMESHVPKVTRLRYLRDSSGGCNFDFAPFRRLPLTWYMNEPGDTSDGVNFVNSHVVNIACETSPTHFHPRQAIGGGLAQHEFYLVLNPSTYRLDTYGRRASIVTYPDLGALERYEVHALQPGQFVAIPPGTGHRGLDVFVNVITVPGFKPHNEYYIDQDVRDASGGHAPFNANLTHLKNYEDLWAYRT